MIPKVELTSKGAALLAKTPAGEAVPVSRWQFGTGALTAGESLDRAALVMPMDELPISSVENRGNQATVLGQFTNVGRPSFHWEELGLFATDPDEGEAIQAGSEQLREFVFGTVLLFSGAAYVTAVVDQSLVFIPREEKAQPGGVATLDDNGKVPKNQLPAVFLEAAPFQVYYNGGGS